MITHEAPVETRVLREASLKDGGCMTSFVFQRRTRIRDLGLPGIGKKFQADVGSRRTPL